MTPTRLASALVLLLAPLASADGQARAPLTAPFEVEGVTYRVGPLTPDSVLGFRIGARHTRPHELVEYVLAVAAARDRVRVATHGRTHEGRPLVHAVVTSPANHARLEQIRLANLRLSDDPRGVPDAALDTMPVVVYMGYSVHGNEASGSEAAVLLLHHLAAGDGAPVQSVLDRAVVIIDPSLNPDGRDRFVDWVNGHRGAAPTADGQDLEHNEPWPNGRTNHYWFDLNRDWLPAQHPESQGRLRLFHAWRPQLHTDFHEMGSDQTFFFQPGIPSRNNPNTPERTFALTRELAGYHARALDRVGSLYYTKESFDDFYYGKGSTYPDVNGSVGILFEQASSRALRRETASGPLAYGVTIRNQFATSLSSLEGAVAMRLKFLAHQRDFYAEAAAEARGNPVKAYLVSLAGDRTRAQAMLQTLARHRIRVHALAQPVTAGGRTFAPGEAYLVPTDQLQTRLLKAAMERVTAFRDSLFYDVSAWSFPLAFGAEVHELRQPPGPALGPQVPEIPTDGGAVVGGRAPHAYVLEWGRHRAPRVLAALLRAGVQASVATAGFEATVAGRPTSTRFRAGAIVIPVRPRGGGLAPDSLHAMVDRLAREHHVVFHALATGLSTEGPDLGGASMRPLPKPSVALAVGRGTDAYDAGQVWHLLGEHAGMPVSLLDASGIDAATLDAYGTLILVSPLPDGRDSARADLLQTWVRGGGSLITIGAATRWAVEHNVVDEKLMPTVPDTGRVAYGDVDAWRGAQLVRGAIFAVTVDPTHPIAFGYGSEAAVFRTGTTVLEPSSTPGANVAGYTASPLLSGYASAANLARIKGSAAILARRLGRGSVVLFVDDPTFRAFWYGTHGFLLNAVLFGRVL